MCLNLTVTTTTKKERLGQLLAMLLIAVVPFATSCATGVISIHTREPFWNSVAATLIYTAAYYTIMIAGFLTTATCITIQSHLSEESYDVPTYIELPLLIIALAGVVVMVALSPALALLYTGVLLERTLTIPHPWLLGLGMAMLAVVSSLTLAAPYSGLIKRKEEKTSDT